MVISCGAMVKSPPAMQEMGLHSLGQEGLEYEVATCSSILAWKISWTEEPGGLQSIGPQRVDRTEYTARRPICWDCIGGALVCREYAC